MARSAAGQLTIVDISDGIDPIVAFATNENHTFSASEDGSVTTATRTGFSSGIRVFVGQDAADFIPSGTLTAGIENTPQYRITSIGYVNADGTTQTGTGFGTPSVADTDNNAVITIPSITTSANPTVTLRVRMQVRNNRGVLVDNIDTIITRTIVRNGAGG